MKNDETDSIPLKGDRALESVDDDRLGFRDLAEQIAISLVDPMLEDGMVIGIEGEWGSGKSSLRFLISHELEKLPEEHRPSVIDFRPWLIGNRDALIASLFGELSSQLDQIESSAGDKARKANRALRIFRNGLGEAGVAVKALGDASGSGKVKLAGEIMKMTGGHSSPRPLSALKKDLVQSLNDLDHRFIITIDDVDRLEPKEVIEILRLVRSVVDLPNVIYLLFYDRDILAESIKNAINIQDGEAYLEKIVQLPLMVPNPEPLQLRQWFYNQIHQIASVKNDDEATRLKLIVDYEGEQQLRTPRSVIRVLDAIRFSWPPLRSVGADLADLVWLELIKDGNPKLYQWIRDYCATAAAVSAGIVRVEDAEKRRKIDKLHEIAPNYFEDTAYQFRFANQLPGVYISNSTENNEIIIDIFGDIVDRQRNESIRNKRLSSPYHYRLYFALDEPSHALASDEFASMWAAADAGAEKTGEALLYLHGKSKKDLINKADNLLGRMRRDAYKTLSAEQCENFLAAFSQVMDEAYWRSPSAGIWNAPLGKYPLWGGAEQLIPLLLSRLGQPASKRRKSVLSKMFRKGKAISWLTSVFRRETFAHGRYGEQSRSEGEWFVTDTELDRITEIMLKRYGKMSPSDVFGGKCLSPVDLLFAWRQGGDKKGPRQLVKNHMQTDEGFMETLEALLREISTIDQASFRASMSCFLDYDETVRRVHDLKNDSEFGERARSLAARIPPNENSATG